MNWDQIEGNWKQFVGAARGKWAELTDDDLESARGSREQFEGMLQERFGAAKDAVRSEVDEFLRSWKAAE
ncbi:MAG: CsbD family protein [Bryobacterales bacterium]|jgi:uncharacterized protein YjbJ (UPF0337 family)|nr:CsbD family protein [Bryobacterales bacterium]